MSTYEDHYDEIATALRGRADHPCEPHASTFAQKAAVPPTPHGETPALHHDLHFAKSVLALHFSRLYALHQHPFGTEEADEVRAAVDVILAAAVAQSKPAVDAVIARVARGIDLTALAAVMLPLVLPKLDEIARAIADEKSEEVQITAAPDAFQQGRINIAANMSATKQPRAYAWRAGESMSHVSPSAPATDSAAITVSERTIDRVMELRGALEFLLRLDLRDLNDRYSDRSDWSPEYRTAVQRAERVLGKIPPAQQYRGPDTNGCGHPDEQPAITEPADPPMRDYSA